MEQITINNKQTNIKRK